MKKNKNSAFVLESLEPRLLFSADSILTPIDGGALLADSGSVLQVPMVSTNGPAEQSEFQAVQARELIFVDSGVEDYQQLIDDLKSPEDEKQQYAFIVLDANRDGIAQISDALDRYQGVTAVHLISHGDDGELQLGDTILTSSNLDQYAAQIQGWQQSLSEQADFMFYSCDLAQSEAGKEFLAELSLLTDADIAASDDATGNALLGGDWDLEYQVGQVEAESRSIANPEESWSGLLTVASYQQGDANGYSGTEDTYIDRTNAGTTHDIDDLTVYQGDREALVKFSNIFGSGANQIPLGATINSATLTLVVSGIEANSMISIHRLLTSWDESSTWDTLVNGVQLGSEAVVSADDSVSGNLTVADFDVTASLAAWSAGATNDGWVLKSDFANDWKGTASEKSTLSVRPMLTVNYDNAGSTSNLVVHLEFEDSAGFLAADSTTNNNDAILAVGGQQNWVPGAIGDAFHFDFSAGNEDYFKILNSPTTENVQEGSFTLAAWFRPDDVPTAPDDLAYGIIGKEGNHTGLWYTSAQKFGFEHTLAGPSYPTITSTNTFAPGSFYHVAVTVDRPAGTMELYVNGQFEGSNSFTPGTASNEYGTQSWRVGTIRDTFGGTIDFPAKGSVDDVRIYSNALSVSEVQALYELGNTAPTIDSIPIISVDENSLYSYTLTASDADPGETLTLSAPILPSWLSFNASTGVLSGTPTNADVGNHDVRLRVTDGKDYTEQNFVITVNNTNAAPTLSLANQISFLPEHTDTTSRVKLADINITDDGMGTNNLSLTGDDAGWFEIVGGNALYLKAGTTLDYESPIDFDGDNVYDVTVSVDDPTLPATPEDSVAFSLTVVDSTVLDQFNTQSFANNDGPSNWVGPWVEKGESNGALTGVIRVTAGGRLRFGGSNVSDFNTYKLDRQANFSGASDVFLSYTYQRQLLDEANGKVRIRVSPDGSTWTTVRTFNLVGTDASPIAESINVSSFLSPTGDIFVRIKGAGDDDAESYIFFDDVKIEDNASPNQSPTIISGGGLDTVTLNVAEDTTAVTDVDAADAEDGTSLNYSISGGADAALFNIDANGVVSFNIPPNFEIPTDFGADNLYEVEVTAADSSNSVDTQLLQITVTDENDAPTITSTAIITATEDSPYNYTFTVNDVDAGDALTLSAPTRPSWLSFNASTGVLSGTPTNAEVGTHDVTLRVNDGTVDVDQSFTITVSNTNDAPTITSTAITTATEDSPYSYNFTVNDDDSGDTLSLSAPTLPGWLNFNASTGVLSGTPTNAEVGTHNVVLRVNDGTVDVDQGFTITVSNTNDAPTANGTYTMASTDEETISAAVRVSEIYLDASISSGDVDGDTLGIAVFATTGKGTWEYSTDGVNGWTGFGTVNPNAALLLSDSSYIRYQPDGENGETADFDFRAWDQTAESASINGDPNTGDTVPGGGGMGPFSIGGAKVGITVNAANDLPTITSTATTTAIEDSPYSYTFTVNDVDSGDTLTLSAPTLPSWLSFNASTGVLSGTPDDDDIGTHNVTLRVSDGTVSVDQDFVITVNNLNDTPLITSVPLTSVSEDSPYSYILTASDDDLGDTLTFSAPVLPAWLSFDPGTGVLSGTPDNDDVGTHNVTLRVSDGTVSIDQDFVITVSNANDAPTITGTKPDQFVADNSTISPFADVIISDVDNPAQLLTVVVSLDDVAKGQFTTLNGFIDNLNGTYSFSGTAADATVAIRGLVFNPTDNRVDAGLFEPTFMQISVDDGSGPVVNNVTSVLSESMNDQPTAAADTLSTSEDVKEFIIKPVEDLLINDSDLDKSSLISLDSYAQPLNGALTTNADGSLSYQPDPNFFGTDSFEYTITDGDGGIATGKAFIIVNPVADTPQVTKGLATAGSQSGLIHIDRHVADGAEVTHFRISGISNGTLFFADGVTEVGEGAFITLAQGQAGLRFTPDAGDIKDGSFLVKASRDGVSVEGKAAVATVIVNPLPEDTEDPTEVKEGSAEVNAEDATEEEESSEDDAVLVSNDDVGPDLSAIKDIQPEKKVASFFSIAKDSLENDDFIIKAGGFLSEEGPRNSKLKVLVDKVVYTGLLQTLDNVDIPSLSQETYQLVHKTLDAIQDEIEGEGKYERTVIASTIATSIGLSAGYVVWLLQGGTLLTSVLASMPAWQLADPLSILAGHRSDDEEDDDDSLEKIIEEGSNDEDEDEPDAGGSA